MRRPRPVDAGTAITAAEDRRDIPLLAECTVHFFYTRKKKLRKISTEMNFRPFIPIRLLKILTILRKL